jgi:hypothetical protein
MKIKSIIKILFFLFSVNLFSQEDSLNRLDNLESQAKRLVTEIESIKTENKSLKDSLFILQNMLLVNKNIIKDINLNIDSIQKTIEYEVLSSISKNGEKITIQEVQADSIESNINKISTKLSEVNNELTSTNNKTSENKIKIKDVNDALTQKQKNGLIIVGLIIIMILAVYIILTRRSHVQTKKLSKKQKEILEQQISDSQKIADWLDSKSENNLSAASSENIDHSFAKRVADEITRIGLNLSRMDKEVRGHRQLSSSVRKLEQSLKMNGYEIKNLLNERYDPGMNLEANFITDENLEPGQSIITRVIKPQINYNGKLIQMAQVEVSQSE